MNTKEAKVAATAGMGFAVGKEHLTGTSLFDIGKEIRLLDGWRNWLRNQTRSGPAVTTPANATQQPRRSHKNHENDAMNVSKRIPAEPEFLEEFPYTNQGLNRKE